MQKDVINKANPWGLGVTMTFGVGQFKKNYLHEVEKIPII
jgi:hypothetical protein